MKQIAAACVNAGKEGLPDGDAWNISVDALALDIPVRRAMRDLGARSVRHQLAEHGAPGTSRKSAYLLMSSLGYPEEAVAHDIASFERTARLQVGSTGQILMDLNRFKEASIYFRCFRDQARHEANFERRAVLRSAALLGLGKAELGHEPPRVEQALRHFRQARELQPEDDGICQRISETLVRSGLLSDAATYLKAAIRLAPSNASHHAALSAVGRRAQLFTTAHQSAAEAIAIDPHGPENHQCRGNTYLDEGLAQTPADHEKIKLALTHFEKALRLIGVKNCSSRQQCLESAATALRHLASRAADGDSRRECLARAVQHLQTFETQQQLTPARSFELVEMLAAIGSRSGCLARLDRWMQAYRDDARLRREAEITLSTRLPHHERFDALRRQDSSHAAVMHCTHALILHRLGFIREAADKHRQAIDACVHSGTLKQQVAARYLYGTFLGAQAQKEEIQEQVEMLIAIGDTDGAGQLVSEWGGTLTAKKSLSCGLWHSLGHALTRGAMRGKSGR